MGLAGLLDLEGYRVADSSVDARGWPLYDYQGELVGQVEDLIVDTDALEARYLQLALQDLPRSVVLSVPELQIEARERRVICPKATKRQIEQLPYLGGPDRSEGEQRRLSAAFAPSISRDAASRVPLARSFILLRVDASE